MVKKINRNKTFVIYIVYVDYKMASLAERKLTPEEQREREQDCILTKHKDVPKGKHEYVDEKLQKYVFEGWGGEEDPKVNWLEEHQERLICVLSVSLIKKFEYRNDFNRMDILKQCVRGWVKYDQYVLIFIPVKNILEYKDCFIGLNEEFKGKVQIAPYKLNPYTCGTNMVVGESRNAILDFIRKYKENFTSCVISDERIYDATFGINFVGQLPEDKKNKVKKLRLEYGYKVFNMVRDFLTEKPSEREPLRKDFQKLSDAFDRDVKYIGIEKKFLNKAPICITEPLGKGMRVKGQYAEGEYDGTLLRKSKKKGWWVIKWDGEDKEYEYDENHLRPLKPLKPNLFDSLRDRNMLTMVGFSSGRRYPFHARASEQHLKADDRREKEVIAQITMFRVNREKNYDKDDTDYGWHGQQDYTKTTMCEDNVWSYDWSENKSTGQVGELDSLMFQRKKGVSLTRSTIKVEQLSKCALQELVEACMSNSYLVTDKIVKMKWTPHCEGISLGSQNPSTGYYFMACLLRDLYAACVKKFDEEKDWKTDDESASASKKKVHAISKVLNRSGSLKTTRTHRNRKSLWLKF
jgi:hypothetical protein